MSALTNEQIMLNLKQVIDPEVNINIVDMGLVYGVRFRHENVEVQMTLTSRGCPMEGYLTGQVRSVLESLPEVKEVDIDLIWEPAWSPEKINPLALKVRDMSPVKVNTLDVRPILSAGGEPFGAIMKAIGETQNDGALKLISSFKPAPLFSMLGSKGWQNWIEKAEKDNWVIWFFKADGTTVVPEISVSEKEAAHLQKENPELRERLRINGDKWILDVRKMEPPEPMQLTLEVVSKLPEKVSLVQINERTPQFLFPLLDERGFAYEVQEAGTDVHIHIHKK